MKNYFLVLNQHQKDLIQEAGVESCDLNIDGHDGVVVDEDNLASALRSIGVAISTETGTSLEGIVKVELQPADETEWTPSLLLEPKVTVDNWDGENQNGFVKAVKDILLPVVQTDVVLSVPHGETVNQVSDERLHIFIWSSPSSMRGATPPKRMWGIEVNCRDEGFFSTGQGVPIVDTETNWPVAEIVRGNNLYIHHDICHHGTEAEIEIFRRILEELVMELSATPEEKAEHQRKLAEERKKRSRKQYIQECSRRFEKTIKGTCDKVSKGHREIEELQKKLTRKIRETRGAERKLKQLNACKGGELEKYGNEFDSLSSVPGVEDVQVSDGVIKVFTEHIYITPDGCPNTYDIGKFRMEIYTSGANGGVRFFNLTRKGEYTSGGYGSYHPHVNSRGVPCLGNIKELVAQLIGDDEFSAVAQLGLQYLKSVNVNDSAGETIFKNWPIVLKEVK